MQLSELLQWLSLGQKTGTLLIDGHGVEKRIYFQGGRINSSSSSDQREYLGHFLVSHGYITEEELKMAMEVQEESNILLGKILVMINAISETDLLRLMRKKAEESIYDVFLWEEGDFEFVDGDLPDLKMVPLSLDVTGIIMEGLRRYDEWQRIRLRVPDDSVVPQIVRPLNLDELSEREKLIVPYIDGQRTIEAIALQTHNAEFNVARLVFEGLRNETMALSESERTSRVVVAAGGGGGGSTSGSEVEQFLARGSSSRVCATRRCPSPNRNGRPESSSRRESRAAEAGQPRARSSSSSRAERRTSRKIRRRPTGCSRSPRTSTLRTAAPRRRSDRPSARSRRRSKRTGSRETRSRSSTSPSRS